METETNGYVHSALQLTLVLLDRVSDQKFSEAWSNLHGDSVWVQLEEF